MKNVQLWPVKLGKYTSFSVSDCVLIEVLGSINLNVSSYFACGFQQHFWFVLDLIKSTALKQYMEITGVSCQTKRMCLFSLPLSLREHSRNVNVMYKKKTARPK